MKPFDSSSPFVRPSTTSVDTSENKAFEEVVIEKTSVINKKKPKLKRFSEAASTTLPGISERTSVPFEKAPIIEKIDEEEEKPVVKKAVVEDPLTSNLKDDKKDEGVKKNLFSFDDDEDFKPKVSKPKEPEKNKKIKLLFDD